MPHINRDYRHYITDDFIADEFFQQWVQNPSERHNTFWSEFLLDNPFKHAEVTQAVNFLNNMRFQTAFPNEQEIEYGLQKQLQLIDAISDVKETQPRRKLAPRIFAWTATAIFSAFLLFAGWYFWQPGVVTIEVVTAPGEIKNLVLPDSTKVVMNSSSILRYTSDIHKAPSRDVWLKGEAFFEVKKPSRNEGKPFVVHSGDLNIQVLGTAFNVKQDAPITNVTLNSGSLRISLKNDAGSVLTLQPGDFVQYSDKDKHILRKHVRANLYSAWKESTVLLDSLPLAALAAYLQDVYGFELQANYLPADHCISGSLNLKNEKALLNTIASLLNAEVIKKDTVVILKPKKILAMSSTVDSITILCYNIHHANPPSEPGLIDIEAIRKVIMQHQPDLVALQEVDVHTGRSGKSLHQSGELAKQTGMHEYFGKAINHDGGEYGVAILSKYPLSDTKNTPLPTAVGTNGEPRTLAQATLTLASGKKIIFANTHLDAQQNDTNRILQIKRIIELLKKESLPLVIAGDFNAVPGSMVMNILDKHFTRSCIGDCPFTIPVINSNKTIDFVAYTPATKFKLVSHKVIDEQYASDHLPVLVVLELQ